MKAIVKKISKNTKLIGNKVSKSKCFSFICSKNILKPLSVIFVLFVISFLAYRGMSNSVVVSQSEIVRRTSKHIDLPQTQPLSVVRVDNAENLRSQNAFYKDINEGDYILAYRTMVVIYDLRNDKIVRITRSR